MTRIKIIEEHAKLMLDIRQTLENIHMKMYSQYRSDTITKETIAIYNLLARENKEREK
jgi:hypothetical protein